MIIVQNFYNETVTVKWATTGAGNFYISTLPTITAGILVVNSSSTSLREIVRYSAIGTDGSGNYITIPSAAYRGMGGTTAQTHEIGEPIVGNITAEHWADMQADIAGIVAFGAPDGNETTKGLYQEATNGQVTAGTATGSTGAKLVITPQKLKTFLDSTTKGFVKSMTAHENITAGAPVGVSNAIANTVARAIRPSSTTVSGIAAPIASGAYSSNSCPIGGDKFVYVTYTTDASDTILVQVGQVTTGTKTMALGSAVTVATLASPDSGQQAVVSKLDTDKFIVIYLLDSSATLIKYRIGTVSGTTITLGTEATLVTAASNISAGFFSSEFMSVDKGVLVYKTIIEADSRVVAFTAVGTVATAGSTVALGTLTNNPRHSLIRKIATDKFVLATLEAANSLYGQVGTLSGTVITLGTESQISATTSITTNNLSVINYTTDAFAVAFDKDTNDTNIIVATVSGTTITAGTPIVITSTLQSFYFFLKSSTLLTFIGGTSSKMTDIAISGTTLTQSTVSQKLSNLNFSRAISLDNGEVIAISVTAGTTNYWVYGMSNNFIGIAQATVLKGASVNVLVQGIDANQTGLTPGQVYQIIAGVLTFVSDNTASSTYLTDMAYVRSISATEILV